MNRRPPTDNILRDEWQTWMCMTTVFDATNPTHYSLATASYWRRLSRHAHLAAHSDVKRRAAGDEE